MPFQKTISCTDPLPALLRWADGYSHAAFLITSREDFSAGVGAKREIEIRRSTLVETSKVSKTFEVWKVAHSDKQTRGPDMIDNKTSKVSKTFEVWNAANAEIATKKQDSFEKLEQFQKASSGRILGYLGYDLKNDLENLHSENPDILDMPEAVFFEPELEVDFQSGELHIKSDNESLFAEAVAAINAGAKEESEERREIVFEASTSREEYIEAARSIQAHLQRGDIYETNYCFQFSGRAPGFDPVNDFLKLQKLTEAPFSVFAKLDGRYILSASPERYLKNTNGKLISQPIKGTIARSQNPDEDKALKIQLRNDPKEQNENVMIVDLVRNDLSRVAASGTVKVETLFGVETFKTVHHLVSTISAQLDSNRYSVWDAIKATFPMGSMTGAPKISAMKIIDRHENFKRAGYSGAFGWMDSSGDFDFNVLIRTLFYNSENQTLAFSVGSALTIMAHPEKEYDECLLKADALIRTFQKNPINEPA